MTTAPATAIERIVALRAARVAANEAFFAEEGERVARVCHGMAERFARAGRLLVCGATRADGSDARHVAVEFVHPVIVGKRALPALALDPGDIALLARPEDVVMAFGAGEAVRGAVEGARFAGCLTIGFEEEIGAEIAFLPPSGDPFVRQELVETLYHVLWELVHVFFEHRGLLEGRAAGAVHDTGASSFLYPFLAEREDDLDGVLADVRASVAMKAAEVGALREQTLGDGTEALAEAAMMLRRRLDDGGALLALGNGGSATDAMDAVADLREPPHGWRARRAIDLTADPAILTAIANDIGPEALFARQVIAYGSERDALLALSTSGNSANVIAALRQARSRGLGTVAFVGYDGGRVAAEGLADHVVVTASEHIPRIQEAQAAGWHVLRELIEVVA